MLNGRILCLDLGQKRIGVAVSDLLGYTAQGVEVIQSLGLDEDIKKIKELIKKYNVTRLIVGYPKNLDGTEGNKARSVREQFERIAEEVSCEAELWDERFSTKEAERALELDHVHWKKKKDVIDKMAAQIILQSYLDYLSMKKKKENDLMDEKKLNEEELETVEFVGEKLDACECGDDCECESCAEGDWMDEKILLINENGEEVEFMVDDQFDFEGKTYLVLCENEDSEDAFLFKVEEDENGEMLLKEVEDEEEYERVSAFYFES